MRPRGQGPYENVRANLARRCKDAYIYYCIIGETVRKGNERRYALPGTWRIRLRAEKRLGIRGAGTGHATLLFTLTERKQCHAGSKEVNGMCLSCGCGMPNDSHGDERNITQDDLDRAAQAANMSREQAAQNIMDCCRQMGAEGTQSQASAAQGASA